VGVALPLVAAPSMATAQSAGGCAVDTGSPAVARAVAKLPPDPTYHRSWMLLPDGFGGNFSPCATLSAAIVMIVGGTASSPEQALFFHRGAYIGTATALPRSFITLDVVRTTDNTVVLRYMTPGSCDACGDGTFTSVRFHWDGTRVHMIGTPPPVN
jgi:hypothetical protein